jgi:orotate phosphoribosyltransferase
MAESEMGHASYLEVVFHPRRMQKVVSVFTEQLNELKKYTDIDAIACQGFSGSSIATVLSYTTGIPLLYVRKEKEDTHSYNSVEFPYVGFEKDKFIYVIVDDLIHSGRTVKNIQNEIEHYFQVRGCHVPTELLQIFLYEDVSVTSNLSYLPIFITEF